MLQVRMAFEEDNPLHNLVGVLHFLDGFLTFLFRELRQSLVIE